MSLKKFPIFLQLTAMKTWCKVINDHSFIEVKTLGVYFSITEYSDDILPMRNHIMDLIEGQGVEIVSEEKFNAYLKKLKKQKTLRKF